MPTVNGELGLKQSHRISMFGKIEGWEICDILLVHVAFHLHWHSHSHCADTVEHVYLSCHPLSNLYQVPKKYFQNNFDLLSSHLH